MEILAKREEKGKLSLLASGGTYYVVVLDWGEDILFLAKGDQLAKAFKAPLWQFLECSSCVTDLI
ncbi:MAG: hypothetical protein U9Q89_04875 [Thermodesulfobacteriota bacterium]|nr:hypothetical protein [Thermodesulfobacteriota bacterium]